MGKVPVQGFFNECESWHVGPPTQVEKPQGGQGVTHFALFRVIKLGICWQSCYLLPPSSLSVGEILSCQRNNVKTRRFGGLFFLFHISDRGRGGKWTLFIRSWANYLNPSCTAADTTLTTREEKKLKIWPQDRQTNTAMFLLQTFFCYSTLRVWSPEQKPFGDCLALSRKNQGEVLIKSSGGLFRAESVSTKHLTALCSLIHACNLSMSAPEKN